MQVLLVKASTEAEAEEMSTVAYKVNGSDVTEQEFRAWLKKRDKRLRHAGLSLEHGLAEGKSPSIVTDDEFVNHHHNEHPEKRLREVAKGARAAGLPEHVFYDPTLADKPMDPKAMFTSRSAHKRAVANERSKMRDEDYTKPLHRLHPRLVQEEIKRRATEDPTVLRRDRRELVAEIVDQHGSKG
jgi:hypothetical protein